MMDRRDKSGLWEARFIADSSWISTIASSSYAAMVESMVERRTIGWSRNRGHPVNAGASSQES